MTPTTPLMKQFVAIKKQHPGTILFFRVGDFYEMFFDDAIKASAILQITLTSRDKNSPNPTPLCGFPHHASSGYIARLIRAGESVAICDQVEEASAAKGIVRREVVRVITPGTVLDPELLEAKENNYLVALKWSSRQAFLKAPSVGLSCLDLSTGDFQYLSKDLPSSEIEAELLKLSPKEILLNEKHKDKADYLRGLAASWTIRFVSSRYFEPRESERLLHTHFEVQNSKSFGGGALSLDAAGAILGHLQDTQKSQISNLKSFHPIPTQGLMRIHPLALRHLDLVPFSRSQKEGTLFHLLDHCATAMGARLLKTRILRPFYDLKIIEATQDAVDFFFEHLSLRNELRVYLKQMADLERLIGRIGLRAAQPRDLIALKMSIELLPKIKTVLESDQKNELLPHPERLAALLKNWNALGAVCDRIEAAIVEEPPATLKEGGLIKDGYVPELDEWRRFQKDGRAMLTEIEDRERKRSGIDSLKVRYNRVFGYYIEISKTRIKNLPDDYIRKQTLTNAERFMTEELKVLEEKLSGAKEAIIALEAQAFESLRCDLVQETAAIQEMAKKIAWLDLLSNYAEVAHQNNYSRPKLTSETIIDITEGRHPVLEASGARGKDGFVPNDMQMDRKTAGTLILTGPNMAGKSTFMRQNALIVIMAQMGSFVPASKATIGLCDQVFTRVGAQDAITEGMSTFMVEMTEMAQILRHATDKSLILLDEIGRGTGTFDGISIAWAIAEHVHTKLKARTLFATHYHELTALAASYPGIKNYHVLVREWGEDIVFLRKMVAGGSDKSYGIQVGRLAGLPKTIIKRAKKVLKSLDEQSTPGSVSLQVAEQGSLFADPPTEPEVCFEAHPVVEALEKIDPLNLTPMQALQVLVQLKKTSEST